MKFSQTVTKPSINFHLTPTDSKMLSVQIIDDINQHLLCYTQRIGP